MNQFVGDIDIDVANRDIVIKHFKHVNASNINQLGVESAHNVGIYIQNIPSNPITGRSTIEYKVAEELGYQKIDILNNSIYEDVKNMAHLERLCDVDMVRWYLLEDPDIVAQIPHIGNHFQIVEKISPRSLADLAIILALIRPAKRHLVNEPIDTIKKKIWEKPEDGGYFFKRSHSYSYAMSLIVKLNLMSEVVC